MQGEITIPSTRVTVGSWRVNPASIFLLVWALAFGVGLAGVAVRLLTGHTYAGYTSSIPWGLWVATYIYFVGLSAGAFLISALIYVFGFRRLEPIGKLALFTALVSLIGALFTIWLDLGHEWRFYRVFTSPNPTSMMAWMVWLYTAYSIVLTAELWFALRGDLVEWSTQRSARGRLANLLLGRFRAAASGKVPVVPEPHDREADLRTLRILGAIGVPLAIAFHGGVGALFGVVAAREYWNTPIFPLMFITGALVSGGGLLTGIFAFFWPNRGTFEHREMVVTLSRITLGLLAVYLIMVWAEYSITLYSNVPAATRPLYEIMGGPHPWTFWLFQIGLGAVVPISLLLTRPRSVPWAGVACLLIAFGFLAARLNIVIPGLIEPQLHGLEVAYVEARLSYDYFPSLLEWSVFVFVVALAVGLFWAGLRALPLFPQHEEKSR
jgi:protein NrfD